MVVLIFLLFYFLGEMGIFFYIFIFFLFFFKKLFSFMAFGDNSIVDFLGVSMVFLTVLVFFAMVMSSCLDFYSMNSWLIFLNILVFFFLFLLFVFCTSSFVIFYLVFEMAVVPIFLVVIGWGYSFNRLQSAIYMFLYTFLFSIPFLIFLLFILLNGYSLSFFYTFYSFDFFGFGSLVWLLFCMVFMVKLPVFFFHLWLPKAHVEAPLLGSMILAGVLLKLGGYGIYKLLLFCYYDLLLISLVLSPFSMLGGCLVGFMCVRQVDLKSLVAYSSIVHMAPVFVAYLFMSYWGFMGGLMMMFSHGLCSSCLFFLLNLCYLKMSSRSYLLSRGGLLFIPFFSFIWLLFCICNMGFPPSLSFFSELFIIMEFFSFSYLLVFFIFILMLFSGFYSVMLYLFYNHGGKKNSFNSVSLTMKDLLTSFMCLFYLFFCTFYLMLILCFLIYSNLWY